MATTVKAAYFGYKAFQAFRLLCGDVTVVAELALELAAETAAEVTAELAAEAAAEMAAGLLKDGLNGLGEAALEAAGEEIAEHASDLLDATKDLNESTRDFKHFCSKLSEELGRDNPEAKALIDGAQKLYDLFTDIDADGSGTISREELQQRFSRLGWSTEVANEQFDYLDADKDGEIYLLVLWCVSLSYVGECSLCQQLMVYLRSFGGA